MTWYESVLPGTNAGQSEQHEGKSTYWILTGFADFSCKPVPMRSGACRHPVKAGNPHKYRVREGFKVQESEWVGWDSNPQPTP